MKKFEIKETTSYVAYQIITYSVEAETEFEALQQFNVRFRDADANANVKVLDSYIEKGKISEIGIEIKEMID